MTSLNAGCKDDTYGDVRIDLAGSPNLYADIQHLPFRDGVFDHIRCYHVLEHVPDVKLAIQELVRTSRGNIDLRFPSDEGWLLRTLLPLSELNFVGVLRTINRWRHREHLWIINPRYVTKLLPNATVTKGYITPFSIPLISQGRKGRLWRQFFYPIRVQVEWRIMAIR